MTVATNNIKTMTANCCAKTYNAAATAVNFGKHCVSATGHAVVGVGKKIAGYAVLFFSTLAKHAVYTYNVAKAVTCQSLIRLRNFTAAHKSEIGFASALVITAFAIGYMMKPQTVEETTTTTLQKQVVASETDEKNNINTTFQISETITTV